MLRFTPSASTDLAAWYTLMIENSYQWANDGWGGHIVVSHPPSLLAVRLLV